MAGASPRTRRLRQLAAQLVQRPAPAAKSTTDVHQQLKPAAAVDPLEVASEMDDSEKFMFDLNGFLTIEGFLNQDEVARLNAGFDANWDQRNDCHQTSAAAPVCHCLPSPLGVPLLY